MAAENASTAETAPAVRLALASDNGMRRTALERALAEAGVGVVLSGGLGRAFLERLATCGAQVVLVDLDGEVEAADGLDELLEASDLPIVFNDVVGLTLARAPQQERWFAALVDKVTALAGRSQAVPAGPLGPDAVGLAARPLARNVWVLGASLGGPQALKRFLGALVDDVPAAFVLVQHLGANFVARLADQLDRATGLRVLGVAREGQVLRDGEVLVAPVDRRVLVNGIGSVELRPLPSGAGPYRPSVDVVARDMAARYGAFAGPILFSGMGDDGRRGASAMATAGGAVLPRTRTVASSAACRTMPVPRASSAAAAARRRWRASSMRHLHPEID